LTRSWARRFCTSGASASRPCATEPPREGRADCGADRPAGVGGRPHRGAGGAAQRIDSTAGNRARNPASQAPPRIIRGEKQPWRRADAASEPKSPIDTLLTSCTRCETVFSSVSQTPQQVYEHIELLPIRPDVTWIRLFAGRCACCGACCGPSAQDRARDIATQARPQADSRDTAARCGGACGALCLPPPAFQRLRGRNLDQRRPRGGGSPRLLGEDVTEVKEFVPGTFRVTRRVLHRQ
jgi:hypothetical protein